MNSFFKKVTNFIKPYISLQIIGFFLTILYSLSVFASPIVSKYLIDEIIPTNSKSKLYIGLLMFFTVCVCQPIFGYVKDILFLKITENVTYDIRMKLCSKVIKAPLEFFDKVTKGEILSRILNDGRSASQFISNIFIILIKNIFLILMVIVGMLYQSLELTLIVLLLFVVFIFVNIKLTKKFQKFSLEIQKNYDAACTNISQISERIVTIKSYNKETYVQNNINQLLKKMLKDNKKVSSLSILLNSLANVLMVFSLCVIYGIGSLYVMQHKMTLGTVIAMGLYFQLLIQPVYELLNNNIEYEKSKPIFDRLYEYLDMESEFSNDAYANKNDRCLNEGIKIENLNFTYTNNTEALNNVNMDIPSKGFIGFIGSSGSGKSTFTKLLLKFYNPTSGKIYFSGIESNLLDVTTIRNNISFVSQESEIFNLSVNENIKYGNNRISDAKIVEVCKKLKLHDKVMSLPDGYNSILNERVNLSGGEKQRLSVARALVKDAPIFILDEPTASLDSENELIIKEFIEDISKEKLVIVIAHKLSTLKNSDKIFVFNNGNVSEAESPIL